MRLITALLVVPLLVSCAATPGPAATGPGRTDRDALDVAVAAIETEAAAIDRAADSARLSGQHWLVRHVRHWNLAGLVAGPEPRYLSVRFAQGRAVRDETYYYRGGRLTLVRVRKSWDVDDPLSAPSPPVSQTFFVDGERIIKRIVRIGASAPKTRERAHESAQLLIARGGTLARVLVSREPMQAELERLETWPAELSVD